ncbi:hypothetical protein FZC35_01535 [Candidatus Cytomitobacter indipagum]|uniref:Uncharacterized protein n=1 Tax=Candidatus Cytomitobacter indipagum TaxID=2601575 RepID=A0A5C0UEH6_9PROT|nr:hypothetical protein [Candidatus Cytomitobacter indipagum]QEK38053.1 hypothetical protein FZC35_01535 [Candidatus Cytomitobacter indipagum]
MNKLELTTFERNSGPLTAKQMDGNFLLIEESINKLSDQMVVANKNVESNKSKDFSLNAKDYSNESEWQISEYHDNNIDYIAFTYKGNIIYKAPVLSVKGSLFGCKLKFVPDSESAEKTINRETVAICLKTQSAYYMHNSDMLFIPFVDYSLSERNEEE